MGMETNISLSSQEDLTPKLMKEKSMWISRGTYFRRGTQYHKALQWDVCVSKAEQVAHRKREASSNQWGQRVTKARSAELYGKHSGCEEERGTKNSGRGCRLVVMTEEMVQRQEATPKSTSQVRKNGGSLDNSDSSETGFWSFKCQ